MKEIELRFTPKQTEALEILDDPKVSEVLYGGAKGGGKSVLAVLWAYLECEKLIRFFDIPDNPDFIMPVGFMGRKRGVDFVKTTLETWKRMIPASFYRIRPLDKEIIVQERVKILYGGMDDETSVNKFNSAEFAFVFIDQAEEIVRDELGLLKGALRLRYNGKVPDYKVLLTANPAPSFLKKEYIDSPPEDGSKVFIQALPTDNPFLDQEYIDRLTDAFKHRPELIRAYVFGSWDCLESLDVLIKSSWVQNCVNNEPKVKQDRRVTSADVARYGRDETVIYNLVDNKITGELIYGMKPADATASQIVKMAKRNMSDLIVIDADGFGGGVCDIVKTIIKDDSKLRLMEIYSGKAANNKDRYANAKTEMWFYAADLFAEEQVGLKDDPVLHNDLTSLKYHIIANDRFQVEKKVDVKKRISRSPDRGDALIYGLWGSQFIYKKKFDFKRAPNIAVEKGGYGWHKETVSGRGYGWT